MTSSLRPPSAHSPLPWERSTSEVSVVRSIDGIIAAKAWGHGERGRANAEFIVRACNNYESLLAELKALRIAANRLCDRCQVSTYEDYCRRSIASADAAIAKATDHA